MGASAITAALVAGQFAYKTFDFTMCHKTQNHL